MSAWPLQQQCNNKNNNNKSIYIQFKVFFTKPPVGVWCWHFAETQNFTSYKPNNQKIYFSLCSPYSSAKLYNQNNQLSPWMTLVNNKAQMRFWIDLWADMSEGLRLPDWDGQDGPPNLEIAIFSYGIQICVKGLFVLRLKILEHDEECWSLGGAMC